MAYRVLTTLPSPTAALAVQALEILVSAALNDSAELIGGMSIVHGPEVIEQGLSGPARSKVGYQAFQAVVFPRKGDQS